MNKYVERLYNGVIKENPTFVPTLAVTSSAINGLGMGLSTLVVLVFSNLLISLFRKVIPNGVRMPAYIVIVASLVTVVQFLMQAYLPSLSNALGVYIPLIVVNRCTVFDAGLFTKFIKRFGCIYPSDRCKLYHPWPCRELRIQEWSDRVNL